MRVTSMIHRDLTIVNDIVSHSVHGAKRNRTYLPSPVIVNNATYICTYMFFIVIHSLQQIAAVGTAELVSSGCLKMSLKAVQVIS